MMAWVRFPREIAVKIQELKQKALSLKSLSLKKKKTKPTQSFK